MAPSRPSRPSTQHIWIRLGGVLLVSVLVRVAAAVALGNEVVSLPGTADQLSYHTLALRLLGGHGFTFGQDWWPATPAGAPTAHWSYLYTLLLAGVYALTNSLPILARVVQAAVVGMLQPGLAYLLTRRLFDERTGLVAAAVTAVYAYFVYYAAALMTESLYICAVLATLYLAVVLASPDRHTPLAPARVRLMLAIGLGLAAGTAILLRQVFLLFVPVLFLALLYIGYQQSRVRQALSQVLLAGGLIGAMILPFTIYNYLRFGEFVLLNTNAGFAFYWANHPVYGTQFEPILVSDTANYMTILPRELLSLNEAQLDQELLRRGLGFVTAEPARYLSLSLSRIAPFFMFWPSGDSSLISNISRVASFGVLWPFMLYGTVLAALARGPRLAPAWLLLLFALVYTGIHVLTWTLVRYRLPVDAVLIVFAAYGLVDLANRALARKPAAVIP